MNLDVLFTSGTSLLDRIKLYVPIEIEHIKRANIEIDEDFFEKAREQMRWLNTPPHTEDVLYPSKFSKNSAELRQKLYQCLAALAFVPGGFDFLDMHFEARMDEEMTADEEKPMRDMKSTVEKTTSNVEVSQTIDRAEVATILRSLYQEYQAESAKNAKTYADGLSEILDNTGQSVNRVAIQFAHENMMRFDASLTAIQDIAVRLGYRVPEFEDAHAHTKPY